MQRLPPTFRTAIARSSLAILLLIAALSIGLWIGGNFAGSIGIYSLGKGTNLRFTQGVAEVRGFYAYDVAPPVPLERWHTIAIRNGWTSPRPPSRFAPPNFHFSSGHVSGISDGQTVSPANFWLLRIPLWATALPGLIAGIWLFSKWARRRRIERGQGFAVALSVDDSRQGKASRVDS